MKLILGAATIVFLMACNKPKENFTPGESFQLTRLVDLEDAFVSPDHPLQLDLDGNGQTDIKSSVLLVGDPINKTDQYQFYISTTGETRLLLHPEEYTPALHFNDAIYHEPSAPFNWHLAANSLMFQKTVSLTRPDEWSGRWLVEGHRFLALSLVKNGLPYTAWLELSVNTQTERLIFHRAGICLSARANIRAGR